MVVELAVATLRRRRRWLLVALALLVAHLALGLMRLPSRVFARRADDIGRYRAEGAARFLLGNAQIQGADVIEWLQRHVQAHDCVLWRGRAQGAMELVPALLAPALLVDDSAVPADATTWSGRPLLQAELPDGRRGVVVVEGRRDSLALQVR